MKHLTAFSLLMVGLAVLPAASAQSRHAGHQIAGAWSAQEDYFRATILIEKDADGAWTAFFAGPDLTLGARLSNAVVRGDSLFLEADAVGASFRGAISRSDRRITGTWTQEDMAVSLTLIPATSRTRPARSQDPVLPYPYISQDVVFQSASDVQLAGTLTIPEGSGPHPAVVLVPGTGDNDRDYEMGGHRPFLVLADHLTRHGIAVLRYDERGVGESGGAPFAASFDDQAQDVAAALRTVKDRLEIDAERVGIIGHSVGGVHAPYVHERLERASFLVLLMAPSAPMGPLLREQSPRMAAAHGASDLEVETARALGTAIVTAAAADTDSLTAAAAMAAAFDTAGWTHEAREAGVKANTSPFYRGLVRHNPGPDLEAVDVPVLAVYGRSDLAVTPQENAGRAAALLAAAPTADATVEILGQINHALQPSETGLEDEAAATDITVSPVILDLLADWIKTRTTNSDR